MLNGLRMFFSNRKIIEIQQKLYNNSNELWYKMKYDTLLQIEGISVLSQ